MSQSEAISSGDSSPCSPNTAVAVCRMRSARPASFSSATYQASVNSVSTSTCAGQLLTGGSTLLTTRFTPR